MSGLNGDRARFQKNRKRKMIHRQQVRAVVAGLAAAAEARALAAAAPVAGSDAVALSAAADGGPAHIAD
jgi:hypothetical protein